MLKQLSFFKKEDGMGTIEIIILIALLVGLAFLFRTFAVNFFNDISSGIRDSHQVEQLFIKP